MVAAVLVFILAALNDDHYADLLAWGLAAFAGSFLLADLGWDRRYGSRR
jgi:hypothetical protein